MRFLKFCLFVVLTACVCTIEVCTQDYYELLGISVDASIDDIRRAYKKLTIKFHPTNNMEMFDDAQQSSFAVVSEAYQVLKNENLRKEYDLFGGVQQDLGESWKKDLETFKYFNESFGLYDDDEPLIIHLTRNDFMQSVLESTDLWFINFYYPGLVLCDTFAPILKEMAQKMEGTLQIGVVNCQKEKVLCNEMEFSDFPKLIFYPKAEVYSGPSRVSDLNDFLLQRLPNNLISLSFDTFYETLSKEKYSSQPWVIITCCVEYDELLKLGVILDHLVNVAYISDGERKVCDIIRCDSPGVFYSKINSAVSVSKSESIPVLLLEIQEIVKFVLNLLPQPEELSEKSFKYMQNSTKDWTSSPRLIYFYEKKESSESRIDLKRLEVKLSFKTLGQFSCKKFHASCAALYIQKLPKFILFKPGGSYEFYHGKLTNYDVAKFVREALLSEVQTFTPNMMYEMANSKQPWFVEFCAPWHSACIEFFPHWEKTSVVYGHFVKFGTVDCSVYLAFCRKYNITNYPTAILYNQDVKHTFHGSYNREKLTEFIKDIVHPTLVSLTPESFMNLVGRKMENEIWVINYFYPPCTPRQPHSPEFRQLARLMENEPLVHIGEVDCQTHYTFCRSMELHEFPLIRLYPKWEKNGPETYYTYSEVSYDLRADLLQSWIYSFEPSRVVFLNTVTFKDMLYDRNPWIVYFCGPFCGFCHEVAVKLEKIALDIIPEVKTGKVDCGKYPSVCSSASVEAYPTLLLYVGRKGLDNQGPVGKEVPLHYNEDIYHEITSFLIEQSVLKPKSLPQKLLDFMVLVLHEEL